ncbi:MAG: hypothetical protein JO297_13285 [Nitrososphaeraceae archaeon]|nr:hypothetical protein [Nitrososphaeraceae archaeon]
MKSHSDEYYHHQQQQQQLENARNILLVDDEPDTLFTYKTFLLDIKGYRVDAFHKKHCSILHK